MATTGPNQATAVAEVDLFESPWTNAANAVSQDGSFATNEIAAVTNALDFTSFGTWTGLSAGDSVTAVSIEIRCQLSGAGENPRIGNVRLLLSGDVYGDATAASAAISSSLAYYSTGELVVASAFATTLSGAQAAQSTFGVRVQFNEDSGGITISVDACRVTLTYTPAAAGITGTASITQAANTISASGSVSVVGTASITQGADTISAAGSVSVNGVASITQGADTIIAAGTVETPPVNSVAPAITPTSGAAGETLFTCSEGIWDQGLFQTLAGVALETISGTALETL